MKFCLSFKYPTTANRLLSSPPAWKKGQTIALSQVWSRGLGNPTVDGVAVNGLSSVNFTRLYKFIRKFDTDSLVRFWINILCIPVQESFSKQRKAAISTMGAIYSKASKVLVLDTELMQTCVHVSSIELLMLVLSSGWMRRVWNLREGAVNENVYIQFLDGTVNPVEVSA
jgi:hypothetical protein